MTDFDKSYIPPTVNSMEKLAVWVSEVLQNAYPNLETIGALDDDGEPIKFFCIDSGKFFLTAVEPPEWRHLGSHSIKLNPQHQRSGKIWEHAISLGDATVPIEMRS